MDTREFLLFSACLTLLGGLVPLSSKSLVTAMSIANQDLERYFRSVNANQSLASEERIAMDVYTYAFLNYTYVENQKVRAINFNEEKARYGEGKILSVHGKLVHVSDAEDVKDDTACSVNVLGTNGQMTPAYGISWIALVRRGRCTFEEKVRNVYVKGASGVIIYNDKPVMNLEKMQIKGKTRNITAVITYQDIGLDMALRLDQGFDVTAYIIEGRSGMRPISSLNRTSVLFVAISFIILMVISLVWLIFYYIQKFRYMQSKDQQSRHLCSVTKKAIMKIPTKTGKSTEEKDADTDCCAICIEAYKASDLIRVLPCKHEFHKCCIDPWLIEHRTCPMCKLDVLKFYGYVVGDEIHTTPSPQHMPAINAASPLDDTDVPVVVVGVVPRQTTSMLTAAQSLPHLPFVPTSSLASSLLVPSSPATENSEQNITAGSASRFSATQASVETQTISSIEPHISHECDSYYHRQTTNTTNAIPGINEIDCQRNPRENAHSCGVQFLGSEESILEYEPDRPVSTANPSAVSNAVTSSGARPAGALADLIRSRDFVIDFPRIFVLESGGTMGRRDSMLLEGLPERSQSAMAFPNAREWVFSVANKLEEQHGMRRSRKANQKSDMQEGLLTVRSDSMKARRSRSADGRFFIRRRDSVTTQNRDDDIEGGACGGYGSNRRNSVTSAHAVMKQPQPQPTLKSDILNTRMTNRKRITSVHDGVTNLDVEASTSTMTASVRYAPETPNITIKINDDEFDFVAVE